MKVQEYMLQALKDAVQMELEGRQFYLEAARKVQNPGVRQGPWSIWRNRKSTISRRSTKSTGTWRRTRPGPNPWPPSARPSTNPLSAFWPWLRRTRKTGGKDDLQVLRTGIQMEDCSIDYYTKLARESKNPLARRFFLSVAHEVAWRLSHSDGYAQLPDHAGRLVLCETDEQCGWPVIKRRARGGSFRKITGWN